MNANATGKALVREVVQTFSENGNLVVERDVIVRLLVQLSEALREQAQERTNHVRLSGEVAEATSEIFAKSLVNFIVDTRKESGIRIDMAKTLERIVKDENIKEIVEPTEMKEIKRLIQHNDIEFVERHSADPMPTNQNSGLGVWTWMKIIVFSLFTILALAAVIALTYFASEPLLGDDSRLVSVGAGLLAFAVLYYVLTGISSNARFHGDNSKFQTRIEEEVRRVVRTG
jgi:hypothetical protein